MKYDIVGDIHGCFHEFTELTENLGYRWENHVPVHPEGRMLVFSGDLTDRGPDSINVVKTVTSLVLEKQQALYTPGNHCDKLYRYFKGNNVQIKHGLETTVAEYEALGAAEKRDVKNSFMTLFDQAPLYLQLDDGNLVVAHAGIRPDYIGKQGSKVRTFVLFGDISGEKKPDGTPVRRDWALKYNGNAWVVYGHTPVKEPRTMNNTINIDTGAVFGNTLTAFRYPEMETVSVPSSLPFVENKFRTFTT
jgi:protein phosphatase